MLFWIWVEKLKLKINYFLVDAWTAAGWWNKFEWWIWCGALLFAKWEGVELIWFTGLTFWWIGAALWLLSERWNWCGALLFAACGDI